MTNKITTLEIGTQYNVRQYGEYGDFTTIGTVKFINPEEIISVSDRQGGYYPSKGVVVFSYQDDQGKWQGESSIEEALADWTTL